jgi:hypothetical protein
MSTMQQPQQGNEEVVTGQVTAVIAKGGDKWQIAVQPQGSQYTKNLWTKDAGLVQQMSQNINSHYSFVCGPSYWQMADGKQVRSLWINTVTAPGMAGVSQPAQPLQPSHTPPQGWEQAERDAAPRQPIPQGKPGLAPMEKEERIMREHAMGVVALMLPYLQPDERNAAGMVAVAEGLIAYYRLGKAAFNGQQPAWHRATAEAAEETPPAPAGVDDDIPF